MRSWLWHLKGQLLREKNGSVSHVAEFEPMNFKHVCVQPIGEGKRSKKIAILCLLHHSAAIEKHSSHRLVKAVVYVTSCCSILLVIMSVHLNAKSSSPSYHYGKDNLFRGRGRRRVAVAPASEEVPRLHQSSEATKTPSYRASRLHAKLPDRAYQSIHVLQYTGKGKNAPFVHDQLKATMKPESKVVEVKIPMDTLKFYDESRTEGGFSRETLALKASWPTQTAAFTWEKWWKRRRSADSVASAR